MEKERSGIESGIKEEKNDEGRGGGDCLNGSCRMRRERRSGPTKARKLNRLQRSCRPEKRSESGNLAFETVCLFLAGCDVNAPSGIAKLKITRLISPRYHAAQQCAYLPVFTP